jgi:hypothetical protein
MHRRRLGYFEPAAKSLFRNILQISPSGSIFCADSTRSDRPKSKEIKILAERIKKNVRRSVPPSKHEEEYPRARNAYGGV